MKKIIILISIILSHYAYSQNAVIKGKIFDGKSMETLPGVNISLDSTRGTVSDINGMFILELQPGKYQLTFSFIGYTRIKKNISVNKGENKFLNVQLNEESKLLNTVVVSGSAYEKKVEEEIVSIDVVKPYLIQNTNATDLSQAIERVPGVKVTDGQTSIRGGSGYSYGTGSRVQVIVDGQSYLSPDLGEVRWKFIPLDNIEQVEVIKGASSVLYGSSSMNGVINILTGWATSKPETQIKFYQGMYGSPKRNELAWWERESEEIHVPTFSGASFLHKQKFGNFDLVVGGVLSSHQSYLKDIDEYKAGINFKTRYRPKTLKGLTFGINGNILYERNMRFIFFKDADTSGYIPYPETNTHDRFLLVSICPYIQYFTPNNGRHILRLMFFNMTTFKSQKYNRYKETTPANLLTLSYQYQKKIRGNIVWTSGLDASYGWMKSNYYFYGVTPKTFFAGLYSQIEQKFGHLTIQAGLRDEIYGVTGIKGIDPIIYGDISYNTIAQTSKPTFRGGLNYKISRSTFFRASFGQAYRFPAISEVFLNATLGDNTIRIFPNTKLKPESGWNLEAGLKQEIKISNWRGYLDMALFWMEFKNYITYIFSKYGSGSNLIDFGFKADNVSRARITGLELSAVGEGMIGPVSIRIFGGYTFTYPGDLQSDTSQIKYNKYFENLWATIKGDSINLKSILPYRNRHMARLDIEAEYRNFGLGFSLNYNSQIQRVDDYYVLFSSIIKGINTYVDRYNKGALVLDGRISFNFKEKHKITFLVKNITNLEYADRPGMIGPPRSYTLQYMLNL